MTEFVFEFTTKKGQHKIVNRFETWKCTTMNNESVISVDVQMELTWTKKNTQTKTDDNTKS